MKKFFILFLLSIMSISFAACGGGDDEADEPKMDKTSKMFIGKWSGYGTWEFRADGTCTYTYYNTYTGTWKYASDSKTLITDITNWNWKILSVSEDQWTGTHLAGKGGTHTYNRIK